MSAGFVAQRPARPRARGARCGRGRAARAPAAPPEAPPLQAAAAWHAALPLPHSILPPLPHVRPLHPPRYDYRFKIEDDADKVICQCGAPTCKGTLN